MYIHAYLCLQGKPVEHCKGLCSTRVQMLDIIHTCTYMYMYIHVHVHVYVQYTYVNVRTYMYKHVKKFMRVDKTNVCLVRRYEGRK